MEYIILLTKKQRNFGRNIVEKSSMVYNSFGGGKDRRVLVKRQKQKQRAWLVLLSVIAVWSLILLRQQQESRYALAMEEQARGAEADRPEEGSQEEIREAASGKEGLSEDTGEELPDGRCLVIPKNGQNPEEVILKEDELHNKLELKMSGVYFPEAQKYAAEKWIEEILQELEGAGSLIEGVEPFYDWKTKTFSVSIFLDHLYVPFLYEDESCYYIVLKRPREVYERILVIDAGHGGKHPGTMSSDKAYAEKDINLAVTLALKELLDAREDIKVYYTRLSDDSVYLRPRVTLANEAEADFFISIHSNAFWDKKAHGTEVLYKAEGIASGEAAVSGAAFNETAVSREGITSRQLADICLEEVTKVLQTDARGIWEDEDTYILKHSQVPAALIEVAFLTNRDDLELLCQKEGQALAAKGIYEAILRAYGEEERKIAE